LQSNLTVNLKLQIQSCHFQYYCRWQGLIASDASLLNGLSYSLFNFTLRIDAHNLEEFPYAEVESFFLRENSFLVNEL
jgi:hypothetical protein